MLNAFEAFIAAREREYEKAAHRLMAEQLPRLMGQARDGRPIFTGEITPTVTNTAFCLELLLKCLYLVNNLGSNEKLGHNLRSIFDRLPQKVRNAVAKDYESEIGMGPHLWIQNDEERVAYPDLVQITYNDPSRASGLAASERLGSVGLQWSHSDPASLSIEEVLDQNAQVFVQFRYSWENWEASDPASLTFDFLRIHVAIHVLKRGIIEHTPLGRHEVRYSHDGNEGTFRLGR